MGKTTRPIPVLEELLHTPNQSISEKLKLAIELHIAKLLEDEQPRARQQLPFLVQFGPIILKYRKKKHLLSWVNPDMPHGGLTEYDKHLIYEKIPLHYQLPHQDILTKEFPGKDALSRLHTTHQIGFPCMLKADRGERGVGIYYIADIQQWEQLCTSFENKTREREPSTLQTYCDRPEEWCLLFYNHPDGKLDMGSLVKRNIPFVIGDGKHTVRSLIEKLALSVAQKEKIIQTLSKEEPELLERVPSTGVQQTVVRKASIDFGTTYTDYTSLLTTTQTKQLNTLLQQLLAQLSLLHVGRFDLKAQSLEQLLLGEVRIIECNGGGGMPTQIYDESFSVQEKYQQIEAHAEKMCQIAEQNKQKAKEGGRNIESSILDFLRSIFTSLHKKGLSLTAKSTSSKHLFQLYKELRSLMQTKRV